MECRLKDSQSNNNNNNNNINDLDSPNDNSQNIHGVAETPMGGPRQRNVKDPHYNLIFISLA